MTNIEYKTLLLSEFRQCVIQKESEPLSDEGLQKAMTINENLKAYGFTMTAKDIIRLAQSQSLDSFYDTFKQCIVTDIKAKPMYPDFPKQVLKMDEATFRFHQLVHYFSTYGLEDLLGIKVSKGWMPDVKDTDKTKEDKQLIDLKTIRLITEDEMYSLPLHTILSKRERMTSKETEIVSYICTTLTGKQLFKELKDISIPFKQNLMMLVNTMVDSLPEETCAESIHYICQNTGDVWKCLDYALTRHRFHLSRAQKRIFARTFELYPVEDFKANLVLSNKKARRNILLLKFADYSTFGKSTTRKNLVNDLRDGKLRSWESQVQYLLSNDKDSALPFIAKRPGMMLRMVNWLLKLGYPAEKIESLLTKHAESLSIQTLTSILTKFQFEEDTKVFDICKNVLESRLSYLDTPLKGKKVYLDNSHFDLAHSYIGKSDEGGYLRQGLAYKIPEKVNKIRFFVYWNDKRRVDIDLHSYYIDTHEKSMYHVGWNAEFRGKGMVTSGDITHSDAAEYIDIDLKELNTPYPAFISTSVNLYSGAKNFKDVDTCYVGMMAVKKDGKKHKLYDVKNCFYTHNLTTKSNKVKYGVIDVNNRLLRIEAGPQNTSEMYWDYYEYDDLSQTTIASEPYKFSLKTYLDMIGKKQDVTWVDTKDEADIVLSVEHQDSKKDCVSLLDSNYFMED